MVAFALTYEFVKGKEKRQAILLQFLFIFP